MAKSRNTHHSILAHQNNTLASQTLPNFMHLLGADIVHRNDEDRLVLLQQAFELVEVSGLGAGLAPHVFLNEDRMFKGQVEIWY